MKTVLAWTIALLAIVGIGVAVEAGLGVGAAPTSPNTSAAGQATSNKPANLQVFVDPDATSAEVAAVEAYLEGSSEVSWCRFLDHEQSHALMRQVLGNDANVRAVTPAETPTLFWCVLSVPNAAPLASQLHTLPNVYALNYGVRIGPPPSP